MRKILFLIVVVFSLSCDPSKVTTNSNNGGYYTTNPYGIADSLLLEGQYLVFLNERKFPPLMTIDDPLSKDDSVALLALALDRKEKIKEVAESHGLKIKDEHYLINAYTGFFQERLNANQISRLLSDTANVVEIHQDFLMQNTRAEMQSERPLLQNTRAEMQNHPEWGYDVGLYTSKAVTYLGGGTVASDPPRKIWIIDSGIESTHRDLAGLVDINLSESFVKAGGPNPPADDSNPLIDFWGHGTACAGLAAAVPANATIPNDSLIGMRGVSQGAKLVSLKVFGEDPNSQYLWVVQAIDYASGPSKLKKGDVLSLSLGSEISNCNQFGLMNKMQYIAQKNEVFFVLAASNAPVTGPDHASNYLPACIDGFGIYTIGSVDLNFQSNTVVYSPFSNFGAPPIDWVVPGDFIFSTYKDDSYVVMQGTSMSAALMAGLIHLTNGVLREKTTVPGINGETDPYPVPCK